jgi:hypothetical protein
MDRETFSNPVWKGVERWSLVATVTCGLIGVVMIYLANYWSAAFLLVAAIVAFRLYRLARRQAFGWLIDEHGERQKVDYWSRGEPVVLHPTTRSQRIADEAHQKTGRWLVIVGCTLTGYPMLAAAIYGYGHPGDGWWVLPAFACIIPVLASIGMTFEEIKYQLGFQDMRGAKVLDGPGRHPGADRARDQKAHGDARPATEAEVLAAGAGAGKRSSVHDQQF